MIAAKSSDDNIVWSWHIWVTKETFADATLTTVATGSHNYSVTPVNLGWVPTGGNSKQGYAPYYQWGRKDPFKGTGAPADLTVYDIDGTAIAGLTYTQSNDATIADNIKNPTMFYYNSTDGPCNTQHYNMWDAQQTATGNITTATVKTVYDPCPAGFCVPTSNLFHFMGNGGSRNDNDWDGTNKGKTWKQATYPAYTTGPDLYFPNLACRKTDGTFGDDNRGHIWSASPESNTCGHSLEVFQDKWQSTFNGRHYGNSVRAVAEE